MKHYMLHHSITTVKTELGSYSEYQIEGNNLRLQTEGTLQTSEYAISISPEKLELSVFINAGTGAFTRFQ
jgi:hypothetical protein